MSNISEVKLYNLRRAAIIAIICAGLFFVFFSTRISSHIERGAEGLYYTLMIFSFLILAVATAFITKTSGGKRKIQLPIAILCIVIGATSVLNLSSRHAYFMGGNDPDLAKTGILLTFTSCGVAIFGIWLLLRRMR